MNCTASVAFTAGMKDTDSVFAAEGTAAHELSEWAREQGKHCKHWIGTEITVGEHSFTVDQSMADYVQRFVDYCDQHPGDAFYEERVHYTAFVPDGWGTADDIRIDGDMTCYLTDLKYGKGIKVYAKNNTQLLLYALGVLQEYGHLYDIKNFKLAIHQPRLDHVDEWVVPVKDLLLWARDVVRPAAEKALGGEGEFKAGSWCRFCPGKNKCEARAMEYVEDFDSLGVADEMSTDKLAEILAKVPEIKSWCADIEKRALSLVQQGIPVGDFKLVAGRSSRYWKDAELAEKAMRATRKVKVADILPAKLVSPAQAEKLLGKKHPLFEEHVATSQGKPVLVPGSDPRPPLQAEASDEFDSLD
jgi:hypothetical protein